VDFLDPGTTRPPHLFRLGLTCEDRFLPPQCHFLCFVSSFGRERGLQAIKPMPHAKGFVAARARHVEQGPGCKPLKVQATILNLMHSFRFPDSSNAFDCGCGCEVYDVWRAITKRRSHKSPTHILPPPTIFCTLFGQTPALTGRVQINPRAKLIELRNLALLCNPLYQLPPCTLYNEQSDL
jgi:hypothetical protein